MKTMFISEHELVESKAGRISVRSAIMFKIAEEEKVEAHRVVISEIALAVDYLGYNIKYSIEQ